MKPRHALFQLAAVAAVMLPAPAIVAQGDGGSGVWDVPRTGGESITEPSPEATAMRRYQDYPITYATGTADISLPLLSLPGGAAPVQLGLSYHTGGIKKSDIPTGVGLGWTLTGLGSVSRQINGFPDEWRGRYGKLDVRMGPQDISYYTEILLGNTDAQYDIYSYNFPGYAGKFMVVNWEIIKLTDSELEISLQRLPTNVDEINAFTFITPDGTKYFFDVKENISFQEYSDQNNWPYNSNDYQAISAWNLSKITAPEDGDVITIEYHSMTPWTRNNSRSLNTFGFSYAVNPNSSSPLVPYTYNHGYNFPTGVLNTTFSNQRLPKKITSRSGSIQFTIRQDYGSRPDNPCDYISEISLYDKTGTTPIKKVTFSNLTKFADLRRKLSSIKIESEGSLLEKYDFTYNNGVVEEGRDVFGYSNGEIPSSGDNSILTPYLTLSDKRKSKENYIQSNILLSISDICGIKTDLVYEPSEIDFGNSHGVFSGKTIIGLRLKYINVSDKVTDRYRRTYFTYESPTCNLPIAHLLTKDFFVLSGTHAYNLDRSYSYSLGATFTSSANTKGCPIENAQIYYGKVTTSVSGTGLSYPIKTEYNYNLDNISCQLITGWYGHSFDVYSAPGEFAEQGKFLNNFKGEAGLPAHVITILSGGPSSGVIEEKIGAEALLTSTVSYEYVNGAYQERLRETNTYDVVDCGQYLTGVNCESAVFRYKEPMALDPVLNITNFEDIYYNYSYVRSYRTVKTGTTVKQTYPDGNSRLMTTQLVNSGVGIGNRKHPGFLDSSADSIFTDGNIQYSPLGIITSCGNESISAYIAKSDQINTSFYNQAVNRGLRNLPVVEKWVVTTSEGTDSIIRNSEYSRFSAFGGLATRPSSVSVKAPGKNEVEISRQSYTSYDYLGRITGMTDATGRRITAEWDPNYDLLTSMSLPDAGLTTTYSYRPLVGCTAITAPSGKTRRFSYEAGRLTAERNTANQTVASYGYRLYGDGSDASDPANRFTATVHDGAATSSQTVDYDGFGMAVRTEADVAGGGRVSSRVDYDALDRPVRQYLPVPVSGGTAPDAASYYSDTAPWRTTTYRALRTDAPLSVIAEGQLMQAHPATMEYLCNTTSGDPMLRCRRYTLGSSATAESITYGSYYPAGQLDVTRSTDADGHRVLTFTDWRGFTILERRVVDATTFADTYRLYDPMGRVRVIIQPEGAKLMEGAAGPWSNSAEALKQYAFIYRYDRRGNCTYSHIPGDGGTTLAYDPQGRPVLRQTATMAERGEVEFFANDRIGRPAISGIIHATMPDDGAAPALTVSFAGTETGPGECGYTADSTEAQELLEDATVTSVTYYDSYGCRTFAGFADISSGFTGDATLAKGLPTATRTAVYGLSEDDECYAEQIKEYQYTLIGYDQEERTTSTVSSTVINQAILINENEYSIQGHLDRMTTSLELPDTTYRLYIYNQHDAQGNILKSEASLTPGKVNHLTPGQSIVSYNYDDLGRQSSAALFPMLSRYIYYNYNLRGQITGIDNPAFVQTIRYENGTTPCYNGNISEIGFGYEYDAASGSVWETDRVAYTYDQLNRLTASTSTDGYHTAYTYNLNSSPLTVQRYGMMSDRSIGLVDDLSMTYDGNRLIKAVDGADPVMLESSLDFHSADGEALYSYDSDGRLISDSGSEVTAIEYSINDMPLKMQKGNNRLEFLYGADGTKHCRSTRTSSMGRAKVVNHYYIGPFQFNNNSTTRTLRLERVNLPWGYFDASTHPMVNLTDYQGNIRGVFSQYHGCAMQATDYYPYGVPKATSTNPQINAYKYGGKELNTDLGIEFFDFEARVQLPTLGLFSRPDPKAGDKPWNSPYLYCSANPINCVDPDGQTDFFNSKLNKQVYINDGLNRVIELSEEDYIELEEKGFRPSYERYDEICKNGIDRSDLLPTFIDVLKNCEFIKHKTTNNCLDNAKLQNNSPVQGSDRRIDTYSESIQDAQEGIAYVCSQLKVGKSVIAGVNYDLHTEGCGNSNKYTYHFINIVGAGFELINGIPINYVSFYDNGTTSLKGRDTTTNRLYNTGNGRYSGTTVHVINVFTYYLTEIRRNK